MNLPLEIVGGGNCKDGHGPYAVRPICIRTPGQEIRRLPLVWCDFTLGPREPAWVEPLTFPTLAFPSVLRASELVRSASARHAQAATLTLFLPAASRRRVASPGERCDSCTRVVCPRSREFVGTASS